MDYNNQHYSLVNEKERDGILYQCYRCDDDPVNCLIVVDGVIHESSDLATDWGSYGL